MPASKSVGNNRLFFRNVFELLLFWRSPGHRAILWQQVVALYDDILSLEPAARKLTRKHKRGV